MVGYLRCIMSMDRVVKYSLIIQILSIHFGFLESWWFHVKKVIREIIKRVLHIRKRMNL